MAVVDRLRVPLRAYGVDFPAFLAVLLAKLRTDVRPREDRAAAGFASKGLVVIAGTNLLLGTTVSLLAALSPGPFTFMAIAQAMVLFMVFITLVIDFTQVLFAEEDAAVLGHHPIADRTLFAAQLAHTGVYLTTVVGALTLGRPRPQDRRPSPGSAQLRRALATRARPGTRTIRPASALIQPCQLIPPGPPEGETIITLLSGSPPSARGTGSNLHARPIPDRLFPNGCDGHRAKSRFIHSGRPAWGY